MSTPRTATKDFLIIPYSNILVDADNQTRERAKKSKEFQQGIEELAESLLDNDVINPLIVKPIPGSTASGGTKYELHDGFRRMTSMAWIAEELAAKTKDAAKLKLIKQRVEQWQKKGVPVRLKQENVRDIALESNLHRENYSTYNIAELITKMVEAGSEQREVAKKIHRSEPWVSAALNAYRKAGKSLRAAWRDGKLPLDTIIKITSGLEGEEQDTAVEKELSSREEGTKESKGKARKAMPKKKVKHHKKMKLSAMKKMAKQFESAPGLYMKGFVDCLNVAAGVMTIDEIRGEREEFKNAEAWLKEKQGEKKTKKTKGAK
jgi:ParB-like chromosome segregation protein Spo0J